MNIPDNMYVEKNEKDFGHSTGQGHPHSFRHTLIHLMWVCGCKWEFIAKWVGHSSATTTCTVYGSITASIQGVPFIRDDTETHKKWLHIAQIIDKPYGAAPSRGWVAGRLWKPPPPPWLAGWLARPWKTLKIRSVPLNRLFSRMVCVWGWVCKGGGGRPPFKNTLSSYSKLPCLRNLP